MSLNATPQALNRALVDDLRQRGELQDAAIEAAFLAVPRHSFLPGVPLERAYADDAIIVKRDSDGSVLSSVSQPSMIAAMLRQLRLQSGDNVLEIGTGTGYSAALTQAIIGDSGKITTIEYDLGMVSQARENLQRIGMGSKITVVQGDGALGYAPRASYDRIVATVGIWDVPEGWEQQLKPMGVLVAPIWIDALQVSAAFQPQPDGTLYSSDNQPCSFIHLRGQAAGPRATYRVGSSPMVLSYSAEQYLDLTAMQWLLSDDADTGYLDTSLNANELWNGFLPYLMLNRPSGTLLALYTLIDDTAAFGITEPGFALIAPGSACFVPYTGGGRIHCFAGADAFLALEGRLKRWNAAGRIDASHLRLRLTPNTSQPSTPDIGLTYPRRDHTLHVWME
jgi:protein-L-isoaspartate(D-aspartate) O-methyltransferase